MFLKARPLPSYSLWHGHMVLNVKLTHCRLWFHPCALVIKNRFNSGYIPSEISRKSNCCRYFDKLSRTFIVLV